MNIYIYGDKSFKQEIHKTLDRANINLKLGSGYIEDVDSLELLKEAIKSSPNDIFLIDNSKIISKDSLNSKIKFLTPKDGIEKEFLEEHGIGDISVDSMDALAKHISKKIAEVMGEDDEDYDIIDDQTIQDLTADDVQVIDDDIKKEDLIDDELSDLLEYDEDSQSDDDEDDIGSDNISTSKADDFSFDDIDLPLDLLSFDEIDEHEHNNLDTIAQNNAVDIDDELADIMSFDGVDIQANMIDDEDEDDDNSDNIENLINIDENDNSLEQITIDSKKQTETIDLPKTTQGVKMSNELDELSNIDENDMMAALQSLDFDAPIITQTPTKNVAKSIKQDTSSSQSISLDGINLDQISSLLSQLLQNKTLDISIKIRD